MSHHQAGRRVFNELMNAMIEEGELTHRPGGLYKYVHSHIEDDAHRSLRRAGILGIYFRRSSSRIHTLDGFIAIDANRADELYDIAGRLCKNSFVPKMVSHPTNPDIVLFGYDLVRTLERYLYQTLTNEVFERYHHVPSHFGCIEKFVVNMYDLISTLESPNFLDDLEEKLEYIWWKPTFYSVFNEEDGIEPFSGPALQSRY